MDKKTLIEITALELLVLSATTIVLNTHLLVLGLATPSVNTVLGAAVFVLLTVLGLLFTQPGPEEIRRD